MKTIQLIVMLIIFLEVEAISQPSYIYEGGVGGGSYAITLASSNAYFYRGGDGDGFGGRSQVADVFLYTGGFGHGHESYHLLSNEGYISEGGSSDGYAQKGLRTAFVWTGAIGTGWTVSGNWSYNIAPDINRPVIIPDGVPNYPYVNTGLFNIGDSPNNGTYKCASLWIQENAFLQTRVNCRIENYGLIQIDGDMRVKKITADAFQNFAPGVVIVDQGGELIIKP